jgi:hypothetical protein
MVHDSSRTPCRPMARLRWIAAGPGHGLLASVLGLAGCYTGLDAAETSSAGNSASSGSDSDGEVDAHDDDTAAVGPAPVRRLTHDEYDNTVRDLLGVEAQLGQTFPPETGFGETFSNAAAQLVVSPLLLERYLWAAEQISLAVDLAELLPCDLATGDRACAGALIEELGLRAYRRPLDEPEIAKLLAVYDAVEADADFVRGVQAIIQALLISPHFLYRLELGSATPEENGRVALTSYQQATRLSYLFWGTMPDEALFAAAAEDALQTPAEIEHHARRLAADPRARQPMMRFYREWLALTGIAGVSKSGDVYPEFDTDLRESMDVAADAFLSWVLWESDATLTTLLTSPVSFVDDRLAQLYGLGESDEAELVRVELDPDERAGILTQPGLLAVLAHADHGDPIHRGLFVRKQLLCEIIPDPPADVMPVVPELDPSVSTRERYQQHSTDPACAACHRMLDPIGFGFEHYDGIGRFRTEDAGLPIDASGEIVGATGPEASFDGVPDLARKLADSAAVHDCVAKQWFRYAFGRAETPIDAAALQWIGESFTAAELDMRELMVAVTQTDAFMHRPAVEVSQ